MDIDKDNNWSWQNLLSKREMIIRFGFQNEDLYTKEEPMKQKLEEDAKRISERIP